MRSYKYETVDVFAQERFGGNQLAVFTDASGLSDAEMQQLSTEMNYSETTFVLPPTDPANTARVRIFTRTRELPFAGHPNVGTAYVLARQGRGNGSALRFEEASGLVEVELLKGADGDVVGAKIRAPQPLVADVELPPAAVAECIGLTEEDIVVSAHPPVRGSVGVHFVVAQVRGAALSKASPHLDKFKSLLAATPALEGRFSLFIYALEDDEHIRARMFAPIGGTWEDPATGSASAILAALLLSLKGGDRATYRLVQGVEMGRTSVLQLTATRTPEGIRATVAGTCVPVFFGEAVLR